MIYDSAIRLWDLRARKEIGRFGEDMFLVEAVAFTPDGRYALTGSLDKDRSACLRLWDIKTQKEVKRIGEHQFGVSSLSISPCGTRVLTGSGLPVVPSPSFRSIKQWDIERGIEIPPPMGSGGWVRSVSYTPDGLLALSLTDLWDLRSGEVVRHYQSSSPFPDVHCSAISPDGRRVLTGHGDQEEHFAPREDCTVRLFDFTTGEEICVFTGHRGGVISVAFSPDGTHALSGDELGDIRLWRLPK
jgi:WD40 repeat protein